MRLLYFAWVRQRIGCSEESLEVPRDVRTVAELMAWLSARGENYASAFADPGRLRAAVNQEHASFNAAIAPGDEIAFFPPVTGG